MKSFSKYIISLTILVVLLLQMDLALLMESLQHSHIWPLTLSLVFILGQIFFLNLRWHTYLNVGRKIVPFNISVLINLAGYFANVFFITSIGGIIAKSALSIRYGVPVAHAIFATFLDRFMTLLALIILSALGMLFLQDVMNKNIYIMLSLSITLTILALIASIIILRSGLLKKYFFATKKRSNIFATLRIFMGNYNLMSKTIVYSLLAQICFILSAYCLSFGFDEAKGHSLEFMALIPIIAFISSLPISFGGWGVREGAFIYGLSLIGFSMENAFMLSIQIGLITLIAPLMVAAPYLWKGELQALREKVQS